MALTFAAGGALLGMMMELTTPLIGAIVTLGSVMLVRQADSALAHSGAGTIAADSRD